MEKESHNILQKSANSMKKIAALMKKLSALHDNIEKNAFVIENVINEAKKELEKIGNVKDQLDQIFQLLENWLSEAQVAQGKYRNTLINDLNELLKDKGLELKGNFPELKCGVLTLDFVTKNEVKIFFGPKISFLSRSSVVPEEIANVILNLNKKFEEETILSDQFLKELLDGYSVVLKQRNLSFGTPVSIVQVMFEIAIKRQKAKFFTDPKRENFKSYSRVQFAYDLYKLKDRIIDGNELKLMVASLSQTKQEDTHIWVPVNDSGTHFALIYFVKI